MDPKYEVINFPIVRLNSKFLFGFFEFLSVMMTVIQVFGEFNDIFGGQVESGSSVGLKLDSPNE